MFEAPTDTQMRKAMRAAHQERADALRQIFGWLFRSGRRTAANHAEKRPAPRREPANLRTC